MKKRVLSLTMAAMSVAMFGILYPEYILLPDTYKYIMEESPIVEEYESEHIGAGEDFDKLLHAKPEQICVTSKLLQYLAEEGIIEWKN